MHIPVVTMTLLLRSLSEADRALLEQHLGYPLPAEDWILTTPDDHALLDFFRDKPREIPLVEYRVNDCSYAQCRGHRFVSFQRFERGRSCNRIKNICVHEYGCFWVLWQHPQWETDFPSRADIPPLQQQLFFS